MEWIKMYEQTPKIGQKCLITIDDLLHNYSIIIAQYTQYNSFYINSCQPYISEENVDYWMPLPKIPKPLNIYKIERRM